MSQKLDRIRVELFHTPVKSLGNEDLKIRLLGPDNNILWKCSSLVMKEKVLNFSEYERLHDKRVPHKH